MKKLLLLFVLIGFTFILKGQTSYITQPTDSLQKLLNTAVANSDFNKAADIKSELDERLADDRKLMDLEAKMADLVKQENYAEAAKTKEEIKKLKRKNQLRGLIATALKKEDYLAADSFKKELLTYYDKQNVQTNSELITPNINSITSSEIKETKTNKGVIGVNLEEITKEKAANLRLNNTNGVLISGVVINGGAYDAGLKANDIIISIDNRNTNTADEVIAIIGEKNVGDVLKVLVIRNTQNITYFVKVKAKPIENNNINSNVNNNKTNNSLTTIDQSFSAIYYNYVSGIPIGFKFFGKDNSVVSLGFGSNEFADYIFRADIGFRTAMGLYLEGGMLSYTIDDKYDNSGDFKFAFDWEVGYAEKIGDLGLLIGMHVVQLNSVQLSLGIGF